MTVRRKRPARVDTRAISSSGRRDTLAPDVAVSALPALLAEKGAVSLFPVMFAEALSRSPGSVVHSHTHADEFQIELVSGAGSCSLGRQTVAISDCACLLIPAGVGHSFTSSALTATRHLLNRVRCRDPILRSLPALVLHLTNRGFIQRLQDEMRAIVEEWQLRQWGYEQAMSLRVSTVLVDVLRLWRQPDASDVPSGTIENACRFMALHHSRNLSIREVADHCGLRADSLCRLFRSRFRITPGHYLLQTRLRHAQALLRSGYMVKECAYRCGFASIHYFSRAFHQHVGVSPSDWAQGRTS